MTAGPGNDVLIGADGADYLNGQDGNDRIRGGGGHDAVFGGGGRDTLRGNVGADDMRGGSGGDHLYGNAGEDRLNGGAGTDVLQRRREHRHRLSLRDDHLDSVAPLRAMLPRFPGSLTKPGKDAGRLCTGSTGATEDAAWRSVSGRGKGRVHCLEGRLPAPAGTRDTSRPCARRRPAVATRSSSRSEGTGVPPGGRPPWAPGPRASPRPSPRGRRVARRPTGRPGAPRARAERGRVPPRATGSRSRRRAAGRGAPRRARAPDPVARSRATIPSRSGGSSSTSGPRWPTRARPRVSSSTGPCHSTASASRPRSTSHGDPTSGAPAAWTRQRPFIRRWLRSTSPPSNVSSRFLPTASTRSRRFPSSRSASPSEAARGFGVTTWTISPSRTRTRSAARRRLSPSGMRRA